jgi:hypothetical protein
VDGNDLFFDADYGPSAINRHKTCPNIDITIFFPYNSAHVESMFNYQPLYVISKTLFLDLHFASPVPFLSFTHLPSLYFARLILSRQNSSSPTWLWEFISQSLIISHANVVQAVWLEESWQRSEKRAQTVRIC